MTPDHAVARARSAAGHGCKYWLGTGGMHPSDLYPWNKDMCCDCSGFVSWTLGLSRLVGPSSPLAGVFPGSWLETSAIYADATAPSPGAFLSIPWEQARPSDLLVYGDRKDADGSRHQGHVAMVSSIGPDGPEAIVHCSLGNWNQHGDAIRETAVEPFWRLRNAVVARCVVVQDMPGDAGPAAATTERSAG